MRKKQNGALSEELSTSVEPELAYAVRELAEQEDRSVSAIVRRAIRAYLIEQKMREKS